MSPRLGIDLRIRRFGLGGTRRYGEELHRAMAADVPPEWELLPFRGWGRLDRDGRMPARLRRTTNLGLDLAWLGAGAPALARRHGLDAWLGPANTVPPALAPTTIVTIHDLNVRLVPHLYDPGYVRVADRLHRLSARRATRVLTPSAFVARQVVEAYGVPPDRVAAVPSGVDHVLRVAPADGTGWPEPYALFVGQTEPHKNVRALLRAWRAGMPRDLHLVIAGPAGRDEEALGAELAADASLRARVHRAGTLPPERLAAGLRAARMFLFPSLAEGFGFPPLEAMALGIPTAVADRAALPEVVGDAALRFDPEDDEALAAVVTRLHLDDDLRARLAEAGPRHTAPLRWARSAERTWEEVLRAVA